MFLAPKRERLDLLSTEMEKACKRLSEQAQESYMADSKYEISIRHHAGDAELPIGCMSLNSRGIIWIKNMNFTQN